MRRDIVVCLIAGLTAMALAGSALGQSMTDDTAAETARRCLNGPVRFPWYDAQKDRLKPIEVKPPKDLENRRSPWETRPARNVSLPDWMWTLLEVLAWFILAATMTALVILLVRAFLADEDRSATAADAEQTGPPIGDIDRIENLPFLMKRPQSDLLAEAQRLYESGEYGQAIIYLYSYFLVQLDKHQFIRLAKGKTNRQYLREARGRLVSVNLFERTMIAFEDVFFGRHSLDRDRFESCWNRIGEFHEELEQIAR